MEMPDSPDDERLLAAEPAEPADPSTPTEMKPDVTPNNAKVLAWLEWGI